MSNSITFLRPLDDDEIVGFRDTQGQYFAVTAGYMQRIGEMLNERAALKADGSIVARGYEESQKEVLRLQAEIQVITSARDTYLKILKLVDTKVENLEAQRDILIRAIGALGNRVKS